MNLRSRPGWSVGARWSLAVLGLSALVAAAWYLLGPGDRDVRALVHSWGLMAAALYLLSHLLRALRVGIFLMFERPPTVKLLSIHFATAWLSAAAPFKLGELARGLGLAVLARQPGSGIAAYLMEKLLDALVLLGVIAFLAATGDVERAPGLLAGVLLTALLLGTAAYVTTRATLRELRTLLVVRSTSDRGLKVLYLLRFLESAHGALRGMLHGRFLLLLVLTATIWALDFAAFAGVTAAAGMPVTVPGDFLRALQSMLQPTSELPAAGYYAQLVGLYLALAALPAAVALLRTAAITRRDPVGFHQHARHKLYVQEVGDAVDR